MSNMIEAWIATLANGAIVRSDEVQSFDHLDDRCVVLVFRVGGTDHHVRCDEATQRIRLFTRRAHKMNGPDATNGEPINMPVAEIITDGSEFRPRLYIHPRHGAMFSTLDLLL